MKKKLLFLSLFVVNTLAFAQCKIIGKPNITINEVAQYTVDVDSRCSNCYEWRNLDNNLVIMNNENQKTVTVKGTGVGSGVLSVDVPTIEGSVRCTFPVNISYSGGSAPVMSNSSDCDINIREVRDVIMSDDAIAFFPDLNDDNYRYYWMIEYLSGETMTSVEKVPQFPFNKTSMRLKTVKLRVTSRTCLKEYTKTYTASNINQEEIDCDISIKDFKEVRVSDDILAFFPSSTMNNYAYTWEVSYYNGETRTSKEKVPQFPANKTTMRVKTVKLKVQSKKCLKEYTKEYTKEAI